MVEEFQFKAGWNAVYLHIDASHATLNELVGSDPDNPIEEIWIWVPPSRGMQFFDNPPTADRRQFGMASVGSVLGSGVPVATPPGQCRVPGPGGR